MSFEPVAAHFAGFGWAVKEIVGNDVGQFMAAIDSSSAGKGKTEPHRG
jgi:transketolase N-terminal domain/subunit